MKCLETDNLSFWTSEYLQTYNEIVETECKSKHESLMFALCFIDIDYYYYMVFSDVCE